MKASSVSIWIVVAPSPIMILLTPACPRVFIMTSVVVHKIDAPGVILVVVPVMVVPVAPVIDPDLDADLRLWRRNGCGRCHKGRGEN
jgi:hypothetical protein